MLSRLLAASRYLVIIAVVGCLLAATVLFLYGGMRIVQTIIETIQSGLVSSKEAKALILSSAKLKLTGKRENSHAKEI